MMTPFLWRSGLPRTERRIKFYDGRAMLNVITEPTADGGCQCDERLPQSALARRQTGE